MNEAETQLTLEILKREIAELKQTIYRSGLSSAGHRAEHGIDFHVPRNNWSATAAPAVTDDSGDGYGIGSIWIDTTNDRVYTCTDATLGAAVWLSGMAFGGPTIFVAASNAAAASISAAHPSYRCDGTADDVQIQAALTALGGTSGGRVVLSEGTFYLTASLNMLQYYWLEGQGRASILSLVANSNVDMISCSGVTQYQIRIKNLTLEGNKANQASGNGINVNGMYDAQIENVVIYNTKQAGIYGDGATKAFEMLKISHCRVQSPTTHGYSLANGDLNLLLGNSAVTCGDTGYNLTQFDSSRLIGNDADSSVNNDYSLTQMTNCQFIGNWSYNSNTGGGNAAIETYLYFKQGLIANNFVLNSNRTGIRLGTLVGGAADIEDLVCAGNVVSNTNGAYNGLLLDGAGAIIDSIIRDNELSNNTNPLSVTVTTNTRTVIERNSPTTITHSTNAGALPVIQSVHIAITTAGAETRTLAAPTFIGQEIVLYAKTLVGNCTITCATTYNEAGDTTITFTATGQAIRLIAVEEGATLRWRSDTGFWGTPWTDLTDGGATTLHSHAAGGGMSLIVKEANETVNNSIVLQDDDELLFAVAADEVWQFEGVLVIDTTAVADFRLTFTGPASAVGSFSAIYGDVVTGNADAGSGQLSGTLVLSSTSGGRLVRFWGGIHNGANAGNLTLQWAQGTAELTDTQVLAGSYLKWQKET